MDQPRLLGSRRRMVERCCARARALPWLAAWRRPPLHVAGSPARLLRPTQRLRHRVLLGLPPLSDRLSGLNQAKSKVNQWFFVRGNRLVLVVCSWSLIEPPAIFPFSSPSPCGLGGFV